MSTVQWLSTTHLDSSTALWTRLGDQLGKTSEKSRLLLDIFPNVIERVDFAYWWSCIGKGLRLQPVQQACFEYVQKKSQKNY